MIIDTEPEKNYTPQVDLTELYLKFKEQYRNLFMLQIGETAFFYRALGRKEYHDLSSSEDFNDFDKEELLCETCVVWPENYDWENCDAGIPTELAKAILKNSYLDSQESRKAVLSYYRSEMYNMDNQITCIINEAFPQYDIETIEKWDVEKTMKYLSRAEWKLTNMHGLQFKDPEGAFDEAPKQQADAQQVSQGQEASYQVQQEDEYDVPSADQRTIRGGTKANKLTPDKMKELQRMKELCPEIDWDNDLGNQGIEGLAQDTVDTTAPALRPGW